MSGPERDKQWDVAVKWVKSPLRGPNSSKEVIGQRWRKNLRQSLQVSM